MTTQEKTALRDKARKDFEGRIYDNTFIFEIGISIFDSGEVHVVLYNENMNTVYNFNVCKYDEILALCKKPFPKDGFSINIAKNEAHELSKYIANHHKCRWSCDVELKLFPEVTLEELKKEAIRIIKTI